MLGCQQDSGETFLVYERKGVPSGSPWLRSRQREHDQLAGTRCAEAKGWNPYMPISDEGDTLGIGESWEGSKYGRYQAISHNPDMAIYRAYYLSSQATRTAARTVKHHY